jgi:ferritin-like metal-binding protein YciE
MRLVSAKLRDLRELYIHSLQKALDMEEQITQALPTIIKKVTDSRLKQLFESHLEETEIHFTLVKGLLLDGAVGEAGPIACKVLASLTSEAQDMVEDASNPSVRDAALIAAGQQVGHFEIAVYGTLRTWAMMLGEMGHAEVLEQILEDEKHADILLIEIAGRVNQNAEMQVRHAA